MYTQLASKKSYNISEAKLKRILEYNERLKEQLELSRIPVSEASKRWDRYKKNKQTFIWPSSN